LSPKINVLKGHAVSAWLKTARKCKYLTDHESSLAHMLQKQFDKAEITTVSAGVFERELANTKDQYLEALKSKTVVGGWRSFFIGFDADSKAVVRRLDSVIESVEATFEALGV
jgi:hypothetical protein